MLKSLSVITFFSADSCLSSLFLISPTSPFVISHAPYLLKCVFSDIVSGLLNSLIKSSGQIPLLIPCLIDVYL